MLGGVLLGGIVGEALRHRGPARRGRRPPAGPELARPARTRRVSEAFFTASLLFCVGPLAVVGAIQDGLSGDYEALATKALLDGFASVALAASLGPGVAFAALTMLVVPGRHLARRGPLRRILAEGGEALAALTSASGVLIIGIGLKLLGVKDVKVGNFLPALLFAPGAGRHRLAVSLRGLGHGRELQPCDRRDLAPDVGPRALDRGGDIVGVLAMLDRHVGGHEHLARPEVDGLDARDARDAGPR